MSNRRRASLNFHWVDLLGQIHIGKLLKNKLSILETDSLQTIHAYIPLGKSSHTPSLKTVALTDLNEIQFKEFGETHDFAK